MPRWLQILLAIVLFVGIMLAVRAVLTAGLHATIPGFTAWMDETVGHTAHGVLLTGFLVLCGAFGFWPRDRAGRMKRLLPRRR
ncbi:hypothetical protein ASG32_02740 [Methylobacterium sp. Leaf361]|uniref:hypothetical protein n=1 Tax=Methylobacterium sp. Leaf361 TaxID=1736352 RepID=UPI0006F2A98C|nr:hypothetical protein [Methylobacterium sp. Leaf361]KQS81685.1 hypothetical protein ASG32_02740 [Methylobacterium sp. Leaf361]